MPEGGIDETYTWTTGSLSVTNGASIWQVTVDDNVSAGQGLSDTSNLKCYFQDVITSGFVNMNLNRYAAPLTFAEDIPSDVKRMTWPNQNPRINKGINCGIIDLLSSSFTPPFVLALTALVALAF